MQMFSLFFMWFFICKVSSGNNTSVSVAKQKTNSYVVSPWMVDSLDTLHISEAFGDGVFHNISKFWNTEKLSDRRVCMLR